MLIINDPLSRFPHGKNALFSAPFPVGESLPRFGGGWEGGINSKN